MNFKKIHNIEAIHISCLIPHEMILPSRWEEIKKQILETKSIDYPLVVDKKSGVILDGHHRFHILQSLGCKKVPCFLVDYFSSDVEVSTWRQDEMAPKKEEVIQRGLAWDMYSPKSTRHTYNFLIPQIQYFLEI